MLKEGLSKKEADDGDDDKKRLIFVAKIKKIESGKTSLPSIRAHFRK